MKTNNKSYSRIDAETYWGDLCVLRSGRSYRERYKIGYGANGRTYRIYRRSGTWEAKCQDANVPMKDFLLITRNLEQMNEKLGEVGK